VDNHEKYYDGKNPNGMDAWKFIENDGSKNYRLSTHRDFVTYNKKKLQGHPDGRVRVIAKKLR